MRKKKNCHVWELEGNFFALDFWLKRNNIIDQVINDVMPGYREVRINAVCAVLPSESGTNIV